MLKARDLAWMAAMVEEWPDTYERKPLVVEEIQRAWKAAKDGKTKTIAIHVRTEHADREREAKNG